MKQKHILSIFLVALSAVFACERVDESQLEGGDSAAEKVQMTFKAVIDGEETETKTVLGGALGDDLRKVLWQPGDKIGVSAETVSSWGNELSDVSEFTANITSNAESSEFKGGVELGARYKAFYPYQVETLRDSANIFIFNLPAEQKYVNGSFDPNAAPMVASARAGETFRFRNLCGVLALQVKGEGAVKSITFKTVTDPGNVVLVAGDYEVNPFFEDAPVISYHGKGSKSVTLSCDIPVELDPEQATPFYIVLPPAVYDSFTVLITLEDGCIMMKEGKNPLTVKRADVVAAGALTYVETLPIDLSEHGTANSYIVSDAGLYSFDAGVIGNGTYGIIADAGFHTSYPAISPAKAEILWQDRHGVIDALPYDATKKRISFIYNGIEGNALVAAKDENGNILWSWHIWATDTPADHLYKNPVGEFTAMDRNLGAIRNDRGEGEEWKDARGLVYQWGRKDPFALDNYISGRYEIQRDYKKVDIADAIANPTVFKGTDYDNWEQNDNDYLWTVSQKTIYDPCPVGYKVPTADIWDGFILDGSDESYNNESNYNIYGSFNCGRDFYYNDSDYAYYPTVIDINLSGMWDSYDNDESLLWSAEDDDDYDHANHFRARYYSIYDSDVLLRKKMPKTYALGIRCMKDENHIDISYPKVNITEIADVTTNAATIHASIEAADLESVTERGIIWGTSKGLTLENGTEVPESGDLQDYTVSLSGLTSATRYYARAYATNERGTGYSAEKVFYTLPDGNAVDLSNKGTANCYIVPPVYGEYSFDASVMGNSKDPVGQIASAEVLWESRNNSAELSAGAVIASVELKGNRVHFQLPTEAKSGNAVIAVKDALGTILWSWHIWVVDFDPVATQQTLYSGAVIMDRNLGATGVVPGSIESFGFYYQWGRKDPFVIPGYMTTTPADAISYEYVDWSNDNIEWTVSHPTVVYDDAQWNDVEDLWDSSKTKYDPCPVGWKVADRHSSDAWSNVYRADNCQEGYFQLSEKSGTPTVYMPAAGRTDGVNCNVDYRFGGYIWTSGWHENLYFWVWNSEVNHEGYYSVDNLMSVRCMKDMSGQTGTGNDYVVDDEYVWE